MAKKSDYEKDEKSIVDLLKATSRGLSISDICRDLKIPRCAIRIVLAKLEGAQKIEIYTVGQSKVHVWKK